MSEPEKDTETYFAVYVHGANRAIAYFAERLSAVGWAREFHAYNYHVIETELPIISMFTDEELAAAKKEGAKLAEFFKAHANE